MPSPDEVYAELEADRASREAEVRLIERMVGAAASDQDRDMLKRSLILLTYAHLEGFCRFSLTAYVGAINALGLTCAVTIPAITAAALSPVFATLRNSQKKHDVFRRSLPDDAFLHMVAREQAFIEDFERVVALKVEIPDKVVDTRSNVDTDILKKLLFQLGLTFEAVETHRASINRLLGIRNSIVHGDRLKVPTDEQIARYVPTAFAVMKFLQGEVFDAMTKATYLKKTPA
jgi:HEPN superfamily RiboL-PSP-like protein